MPTRSLTKFAALGTSLLSLVLFLIVFIPTYVLELEELPEAYSYFVMYSTEISGWLLATVTAILLTVIQFEHGMKATLISAIFLTLPNLVYTIPYYYLIGIAYGLDSVESILLSLGVSILYLAVFYLHALLLYFVIKYIFVKREGENISAFFDGSLLDLSHSATLAVFAASFVEFIIHLVMEIYQVISYLVEYAGDYKGDDIIYIVFRFIFLLGMLFISHFVCFKVKKAVTAKK